LFLGEWVSALVWGVRPVVTSGKTYRQLLTIAKMEIGLPKMAGPLTSGPGPEGAAMVKATVMNDALTANPGEHISKATSSTPGQTEVSFRLWAREGHKTGIWEVTPGVFKSTRPGYDEICQILSGKGTITEEDGSSFEIGPGTLFVTPAGWTGTWTIHETLRKMWVVTDVPTN
jgi:uncharacterized cupin superfamily protein